MPDKRLVLGAAAMSNGSHGIHGLWRLLDARRGPFPPGSHQAYRVEITDSPTVHTHDTARVSPHRSAS